MNITISNTQVNFASVQVSDITDQRSTCSMQVVGLISQNFVKGQPVTVYDDVNKYRVFAGFVWDAKAFVPSVNSTTCFWSITCVDNVYLADKRVIAKSYSNQLAGFIVNDIVANFLAAEGVLSTRAQPVFARGSVTYTNAGAQVASGVARYETFTQQGMYFDEATTNLLSANQSSVETDTTGFTGVNGTLTRITTDHWQGSACLQCVTTSTSADSGFFTNNIAGTGGTTYACSVWVKAVAGSLLKLIAKDNTNSATTTTNFTATGSWQRVTNTVTYGASSGTGLQLKVLTQGAQPIVTIFADGMQIEAKDHATTWAQGGTPRSADTLSLATAAVLHASEGAVVARVYFTSGVHSSAQDRYIFHISDSSGSSANNRISLYHAAGSSQWRLFCTNGSGSGNGLNVADGYVSDGWHTIGIRWSSTECAIYIDGVKSGTTASITTLPASLGSTLYVGCKGSADTTTQFDSLINSVYFSYAWLNDSLMAALTGLSTLGYDDNASYAISLAGAISGQSTIFDGSTVGTAIFNYSYASDSIAKIAEQCDYYWNIDHYKLARFNPRTARPAPFLLNAGLTYAGSSVMRNGTIYVTSTAPDYRNTEYLVGGTDTTSTQTEVQTGDGQKQTFTFGFPLAATPTISTNTAGAGYVARTVGIKGVDTGKDFYWSQGDANIYQDSSGTKLTSADLIKNVYTGQFPVVIYAQDNHQVGLRATTEGTSGIVEVAEVAPADVINRSAGYQFANGKLQRYGVIASILEFETFTPGLRPGQIATANVAEYNVSNQQFLIQQVDVSNADAKTIVYKVTAISGPASNTWTEFFKVLASQQGIIDQLNVGQASTLIIENSTTESWSWTESSTPHVYTCPICSGSTLCGGAVIVC